MLLHFVYWVFSSWWGVYLACLWSIKTTLFIHISTIYCAILGYCEKKEVTQAFVTNWIVGE